MNIIKDLNADINILNSIESQLFNVVTLPLFPPSLDAIQGLHSNVPNDAIFQRPSSYVNYRSDGGVSLGTVGKDYVATQPIDLFNAFTQCLIATGADLSKFRYDTFKDGAKVRFSTHLGDFSFKNKARKVDDIETRLILETGFDGNTKTTFSLETLRLVCTNGMTVTESKSAVSFKNTRGNLGKISIACNDLAKMGGKLEDYQTKIAAYNAKDITAKDVEAFSTKILGYSIKDKLELGKVKLARLDAFMESIEIEFKRTGATAWGLLNGATHFTNHVAETSDRNEYLYNGGGRLINAKAEKFIEVLIK
jgi:hypothetical protein